MNEFPFVSFIIVTRNEEKYIIDCIKSVVSQTYPKDKYELIIVDGMSTDKTRKLLEEEKNKISLLYPLFSVSIYDNEKLILSSGWNIGIKNAKGDYVVRIDAHAKAREDFLKKSVETMLSHDAVCVGGKLITMSLDGDNKVVSKVLSSPFGVGNSSFRVSCKAGYVDTVVYGLYDKKIFNEVGLFDEGFVRNQDMELHSRIKKCGCRFYFNPEIVSEYYSRNTIKKMLRQGFLNGKWNMALLKKNSKGPSLRHLVPFAFVLFILLSIAFGFLFRPIWFICVGVLVLHLLLGLIFAVKKTRRIVEIIQMPFLFLSLHLLYGLGFFAGIFIKIDKGD